jgi:hypothetical protein
MIDCLDLVSPLDIDSHTEGSAPAPHHPLTKAPLFFIRSLFNSSRVIAEDYHFIVPVVNPSIIPFIQSVKEVKVYSSINRVPK